MSYGNRESAMSDQLLNDTGTQGNSPFEHYTQQESIQQDESEIKTYGSLQNNNRCPRGYKKLSILGKGGCAIVWLCQSLKDPDIKVAAK